MRKVRIAVLAAAIAAAGCTTAAGAPTSVETAVATNAGSPRAVPVETPRPIPSTAPTTIVEPLPDDLIGAWYETAPGYWWFIRAGDPVCVSVIRTDLDCLVYQLVGQTAAMGSASMEGRILHIDWVRGYCARQRTNFGIAVAGDTLKFFDQPDDCGGFSLAITRAGTGTAPSAPPAPVQ